MAQQNQNQQKAGQQNIHRPQQDQFNPKNPQNVKGRGADQKLKSKSIDSDADDLDNEDEGATWGADDDSDMESVVPKKKGAQKRH